MAHSPVPTVPVYGPDFFSEDAITNPVAHYHAMQALGPIVWLPHQGNFALTRYDLVAQALRDNETFISGKGVAADATACEITHGTTLASDGENHRQMRQAVTAPLLPGALEEIRPMIESMAVELIEGLIAKGDFDAIADLATYLPLKVVRDLVGLPDFGKDNMLRWTSAAFNPFGGDLECPRPSGSRCL